MEQFFIRDLDDEETQAIRSSKQVQSMSRKEMDLHNLVDHPIPKAKRLVTEP